MVVVCIPTYKRSKLLELMLCDLTTQLRQPDLVAIIDGDPVTGVTKEMLQSLQLPFPIAYVPSNHANLPYQRYLGWRIASQVGDNILVYFDDDERILSQNVLSMLVDPLGKGGVVGVGSHIRFGELHDSSDATVVRSSSSKETYLVRVFGAGRGTPPGGLTPTGHRKLPMDTGADYVEVEWLHGGVMAFWMPAIQQSTFSDDLFALAYIRCGLGEDTFLSRRVGAKGRLLYSFRAIVDHPNTDTPKSYPHDAYHFAYAVAYSRRFLNDYYRVYHPPTMSDRWALLKSYGGNVFLAWLRSLREPSQFNLSLAHGNICGAVHGLIHPPTAKRLTEHINWWADAEVALQATELIEYEVS